MLRLHHMLCTQAATQIMSVHMDNIFVQLLVHTCIPWYVWLVLQHSRILETQTKIICVSKVSC